MTSHSGIKNGEKKNYEQVLRYIRILKYDHSLSNCSTYFFHSHQAHKGIGLSFDINGDIFALKWEKYLHIQYVVNSSIWLESDSNLLREEFVAGLKRCRRSWLRCLQHQSQRHPQGLLRPQ